MLWLLLLACVPKTELLTARTATPVDVAVVVESSTGAAPVDPPEAMAAAVDAVLQARMLPPTRVNAAVWGEAFSGRRGSAQRLAWLVEHGGQPMLLLVEARATYYSEMNGRYRWTVAVDATLVPRDRPAEAVETAFEVPVFLNFYHQKEDAALEAAMPVVSRRLGDLVDGWISAQAPG